MVGGVWKDTPFIYQLFTIDISYSTIDDSPEMHELSIAVSMVEMAAEEAARRGGAQVHAIHLRLGQLSGVVKDALLFSYELACAGTTLEGSRLVIEEIPVVVFCPACETERTLDSLQRFCCPVCGTPTDEVLRGRELEVFALEING
jgi:hydrogenase nickel incorporation protein HypA/HybF